MRQRVILLPALPGKLAPVVRARLTTPVVIHYLEPGMAGAMPAIIMPGSSTDDEMFILLGSKLANHDALINAPAP